MNKAILPTICFIAGLAAGVVLIPRGAGGGFGREGGSDGGGTGAAVLPSGGSREGSKSGVRADGRRAAATGSGASRVGLDELLELASGSNHNGALLAMYRLVENLDAAELRTLAGELESLPGNDHRQWQARNAVLQRFAELDPDGALSYVRTIKNQGVRQMGISAVMGEISSRDPGKALAIARGFEDNLEFQCALGALASANTGGSPEALLDLIEEHGGVRMDWSYRQMFDNWARHDPQSAMARLADLPPGDARNYAMQGIAAGLVQTSPEAGLEWAAGLASNQERNQIMGTIIGALAASDPARAVTVLAGIENANQRQQLLGTLASQWVSADPAAARTWMESLPPQDRVMAMQGSMHQLSNDLEWSVAQLAGLPVSSRTADLAGNLARNWARRDPKAASEWVQTLPDGGMRQGARQSLVQEWAQSDPAGAAEFLSGETLGQNDAYMASTVAGQLVVRDPEGAISWMDSLKMDQNARANMISNTVSNWAQHDAAAAADFVLQLEGDTRNNAISSLIGNWANQDMEEALAWSRGLEDVKERRNAMGSLISNAAHQDPDRAAAMLDEVAGDFADEEGRNVLASSAHSIAANWARMDPARAAEWAGGLPESMDRSGTLGEVVGSWAEADPVAAAEWVGEFPPGADRDGAVGGLVSRIAHQDPEAAFLWAVTIGDEEKQGQHVGRTVSQWAGSDPDAARAAVESANLSDEVRKRALGILERR